MKVQDNTITAADFSPESPVSLPTSLNHSLDQLFQRLQASLHNNQLQLTPELLGFVNGLDNGLDEIFGGISGNLLDGLMLIHQPEIKYFEGDPGQVGEPGQSLSPGEISTHPENIKVRLTGKVEAFKTTGVQLLAEFFLQDNQPNLTLKFQLPTTENEPDAALGLGSFFPEVPVVKAMEFTRPTLILTSGEGLYDPALDANLNRGFNCFGDVEVATSDDQNLRLLGGFLKVQRLGFYAGIAGNRLAPKYLLEAAIHQNMAIMNGKNFKLGYTSSEIAMEISGVLPEPTLGIAQEIVVILRENGQDNHLIFIGGVKGQAESVTGFFTLDATGQSAEGQPATLEPTREWRNPFGIPGLTIRQLSLQLGLTYAFPWIDNIGLHGDLKIGEIDGSVSILVDSNDPDQFVLAGSMDRITLLQMISTLSIPTFVAYNALPSGLRQSFEQIINVALEEVKLNIVPVATQIGAIDFQETGITFAGRLDAWGWNASAFVNVDPEMASLSGQNMAAIIWGTASCK
ncbi:MAG: hypothetical protein HC825_05645 [Oscillatoriales cyanobacterium RM1_1_9]|nr:hypothetical protein [Oscillatoriales cyanobacterium RM1_1_9]